MQREPDVETETKWSQSETRSDRGFARSYCLEAERTFAILHDQPALNSNSCNVGLWGEVNEVRVEFLFVGGSAAVSDKRTKGAGM